MVNPIEPGIVTIQRLSDGTRVVTQAAPVIRVSAELVLAGELDADAIEPGGVLRLDTEGLYRYRHVRNEGEHWLIYERITEGPS